MVVSEFLHRRFLAAAVVMGCLVAGCGGSGGGSTTHTFPGGVTPIGPANLTANVTQLMRANQTQLKNVKAHCPSGPVTQFPVVCHFTAIQTKPLPVSTRKGKHGRKITLYAHFTGPYRVAGTISVFGVYFRTRTYEYGLNYAPTH